MATRATGQTGFDAFLRYGLLSEAAGRRSIVTEGDSWRAPRRSSEPLDASTVGPDRHPRIKRDPIIPRIHAEAQCVAIVISHRAFRLPGCKRTKRRYPGDRAERRGFTADARNAHLGPDRQAI